MDDRRHLPHYLRLLADAAGIEAAVSLALARRGMRMRIPQRAEGSVLADIVGIDAASQIVKDLADQVVEIPLAKRLLAQWLRDEGWGVERIANRLGIARRTLQYWFSDTTPSRQADLFDRAG